jgi:hypothetical protein
MKVTPYIREKLNENISQEKVIIYRAIKSKEKSR